MESQVKSKPKQRRRKRKSISDRRKTCYKDNYYPCPHCEWTFDKVSRRLIHLREIHGIGSKLPQIYKCELCEYRGPSKDRVGQHMRVHSDVKPLACTHPGCNFRTKYPQGLKDHLPRHDPELSSRFKCKLCPKSFPHLYQLERHLCSHTREAYQKCSQCDFKAVNITGLVSHQKICHSEGYRKKWPTPRIPVAAADHVPFKYKEIKNYYRGTSKFHCLFPGCTFVTNHRVSVRYHINCHQAPSEAKWYKCDFSGCGFQTRTSVCLKNHYKTHNPNRKRDHQCSVCTKKFLDQNALRRHMRTHGNEVYCCLFCDYEAVESSNVYRHLKMYHGDLWRRGMKLQKGVCSNPDNTGRNVNGDMKQSGMRIIVSGRHNVRRTVVNYGPMVILERNNIVQL